MREGGRGVVGWLVGWLVKVSWLSGSHVGICCQIVCGQPLVVTPLAFSCNTPTTHPPPCANPPCRPHTHHCCTCLYALQVVLLLCRLAHSVCVCQLPHQQALQLHRVVVLQRSTLLPRQRAQDCTRVVVYEPGEFVNCTAAVECG